LKRELDPVPPENPAPPPLTRRAAQRARLARIREEAEPLIDEERRSALRALLRQPLLVPNGATGPDFILVRRHRAWLADWFAHYADWSLVVSAEAARLRKLPAVSSDSTRGAVEPLSGETFNRHRYVLFCLALAALERSDRQITLGRLAEQVVIALAGDPAFAANGFIWSLDQFAGRRDFVHTLRLLVLCGVLRRLEGNEERLLHDQKTDALYNVSRPVLALLIAARRSPSLILEPDFFTRLNALLDNAVPDTPDARNRALGCGLRAVAGHSGLHSRWFFVTGQRVGQDLFLQTAQRVPLGRERLAEAMSGAGKIFLKAEDYRRAVDEALFGLGPRYAALLELLLRRRRPQLSRKLDEDELSSALSDALPTLPSAIVDEVAESFQSLQADRERLREFTAAQAAVTAFLAEYRTYVRIAVRRRANAFREAHSAYESAQREARDAATRFERADKELIALTNLAAALEAQLAGAESAERTLRESPEMRTAEEVDLAREIAAGADTVWTAAKRDEQAAANAWAQAKSRQRATEDQAAELGRDLAEKRSAADAAALAAELEEAHRQQVPLHFGGDGALRPDEAEFALRRVLGQRERAIALLRERDRSVAAAGRICEAADRALQQAEDAASAAREAEHTARETLEARGAELAESYGAWSSRTAQLKPLGNVIKTRFTDIFKRCAISSLSTGTLRRRTKATKLSWSVACFRLVRIR